MIKKKANYKMATKHNRSEEEITPFVWILSSQNFWNTSRSWETEKQEWTYNQERSYETNENESTSEKRVIDMKEETSSMTIKEIVSTVMEEFGIIREDDNNLHLIQNKICKLNIGNESKSILLF